jgi:hypothetical protein
MSRLRMCVRNRTGTADKFNFERLASADMAAKAGRHVQTPILNVVHSRRQAPQNTWSWGEATDNDDDVRTLIDPTNEYTRAAAAALGRRYDTTITTALNAAAADGAGGTTPLPASQQIGTAGSALSVDLARQAKKLLDQAEVGTMQGGMRYAVTTSKGLEDMLKETEVTSSDYNTVKALVTGELDTFLGFKWIRTELTDPACAATASNTFAWFYEHNSVGLAIADDRFTRIAEDPGLSFATRIYTECTIGAVRVEDSGVVRVEHLA